jgi:outer membrane protein
MPNLAHALAAGLAILLAPCTGTASAQQHDDLPWSFRTSAFITGSSDVSAEGYTALSAIGLGAGVHRRMSSLVSVELNLAVASREIVIEGESGGEASQGSIESIPVNLLAQVRPRLGGRVHPYAGLGINFTPVWEKTGALDSYDIAPTFGIALQLGADLDLSRAILLNLDLGWNSATPDLEAGGQHVTTIAINPLTLSAGVGFRF